MSETELLSLADSIDSARARAVSRDYPALEGQALCILLSVAFPPLAPRTAWQVEAVQRILREGWRVERERGDLLLRLLGTLGDPGDAVRFSANLRRAVWEEKARIALRELLPHRLGGATVDITARELSDLAEVAFELALREARKYAAQRFGEPRRNDGEESTFVVLGMGKLGGRELNAGSDVDVVFCYDTDEGASQLSLHDHWTRVARRLVSTLETSSEDGFVWRVDLRLRPEGSQGPIVNSLLAAERYYETWGRLWERAALLRTRSIAGSPELGSVFEREVVLPFVYRHEVDPEIARALAELVQRSRAELSSDPARDLKLGPGGIREAEFFIQSLQLIWGGRESSLRVTGSLPALSRLRSRGLVSDREMRGIAGAYLLLRRVEHRVQWMSGIQTHLLPEDEPELGRLARSLGYSGADELAEQVASARDRVSDLFGALAPSRPRAPPRFASLLAKIEAGSADLPDLAEAQFGSAEISEHLLALARRPDDLLGSLTYERHPELPDRMLQAIADSPDPEQAARHLRSFFSRFIAPEPYISFLAEDPRTPHMWATALGASEFVGDAVAARPDLADAILFGGGGVSDPVDVVAGEVEASAAATPDNADAYERQERFVSALRRARGRVMVEVAVADLASSIGTRDATRVLASLADEIIDRSVLFEMGGNPSGLTVIAVGKLGGRDIGYGSDLDVLFIYDPEAAPANEDPPEYFVKRAQHILRLLSEPHPAGRGYELDARLRPSGSHGLLVTSLPSFARYHNVPQNGADPAAAGPSVLSSGAAWERQALLRARACAGDRELGERVIAVAHVAAYERGAPPVDEMWRLRLRMEHELAAERNGYYDLKTGCGGLLDVEFAVQWLQMNHGRDVRVRTTDTVDALKALHAASYLERSHYETLLDGYLFLRRLEQRMHVLHGSGSTVIDASAPALHKLARRMGLGDSGRATAGELLLTRYMDVTRAVRASFRAVLGVPDG
ncbi:MAG TPA: bifunctional [glutamate--ammonia ligase]-adenylyl-L-tyrosine phosphorylase/[glutamate--ammonia-ligase] adenylyltransferase [Polyangiaceae bacterium]|nr:bifunctional [glutamate--ammonia ligase]-adenylyl-L-tyrosine phosphorylase/[glutamate--ammonia-ligase] adenylyltransferase [Polyangiaceae bacterium]